MSEVSGGPLTVGTAGHIDHGKTALVQALTGVNTDRLPEEQARGITIVLGFAQLRLPGGRLLSLIDVPGHERLVRVMVSGASGIDLFLLVIAADDGVMPQTLEHIRVLQALDVRAGVVAVTKADLADPAPVMEAAAELLPGTECVACSARTGRGVADVAEALDRVSARLVHREPSPGEAVLHVDRAFTIRGAGTVLTGTLWSGSIGRGDRLQLLPSGRAVRVRGVHVHDHQVERADAGQRVAVNLTGVDLRQVNRGDVLVAEAAALDATFRLDVELSLYEPLQAGERVQVHHGTRNVPARLRRHPDGLWQLRVERPLIAAEGDHLVIRRISPPGTVAGGRVVHASPSGGRAAAPDAGRDAAPPGAGRHAAPPGAGRHAAPPGAGRHAAPASPPQTASTVRSPTLDAATLALEERLRAAGAEPPSEQELDDQRASLRSLQAAGRAVRVGRMYAHVDAVSGVRGLVERIIREEGSVTLARLRDELGTSRKYAQAYLEHLDAARVTRRLPDDTRVLRAGPRQA